MNGLRRFLVGAAIVLLMPLFAWAGPVNINTADAETLSAELDGIGLTKAQAIVQYRTTNGPFQSAAELVEVKGIGARTVEINRDNIQIQAPRKSSK
jgi:competence protein ComEA